MYVFAAVVPSQGLMTTLVLPSADTAMMNIFLEPVSQTFADFFMVMQVDQAGWHHSKALIVPENIRLLAQPAYSPEVNPVEPLWEELREKYLHNKLVPSLALLVEQLCKGLNELTAVPERLRSMMFFPHFRIEV